MITSRQAVALGTGAAVRIDAEETDSAAGHGIMVVWQDTGTVILGNSSVAAGTGVRLPVAVGQRDSFELDQHEQLWGLAQSGTIHFDVLGLGE